MATSNPGRKHERATLDLYINKIVGDEPRLVRTRDISESGMFLYKLLEPEVESDFVGLEMKLPNSQEVIWAVGKIVREEKRDEANPFVRIPIVMGIGYARNVAVVKSSQVVIAVDVD